jgi:GGDEF domain-containing protein
MMVEMLCLAAEITAALLLLSIAMPNRGVIEKPSTRDPSPLLESLRTQAEAVRSLQFLSLVAGLRQYEHLEDHQRAAGLGEPSRLGDCLAWSQELLVLEDINPATRLPTRQAMGNLLRTAEQWKAVLATPVKTVWLRQDPLGEVEKQHGPVAAELLMRQVADVLQVLVRGRGLVFCIDPQTFGMVFIEPSMKTVVEIGRELRQRVMSHDFRIQDQSIQLVPAVALADCPTPLVIDELWDLLEEGLAEVTASAARPGMYWDRSISRWLPMKREEPDQAGEQHSDLSSAAPLEVATHSGQNPGEQNVDRPAKSHGPAEEAKGVDGLAGVEFSSDDIAALFQAAAISQSRKLAAGSQAGPQPVSDSRPGSAPLRTPAAAVNAVETDLEADVASLEQTVDAGIRSTTAATELIASRQ